MSRVERAILAATLVVLAGGAAVYFAMSKSGSGPATAPSGTPRTGPHGEAPTLAADSDAIDRETVENGGEPTHPRTSSGRIPTALRQPTGDDLSNPARVLELLHQHLADPNPRWDWIADLVAVLPTLDAQTKAALVEQLIHGNAAGSLQAFARLRDGSVVPDLLRALDDPTVDAHDRGAILEALSTMPGGDPADVVTGIESRMNGDFAHDLPYLRAIGRRGGQEAARALVEAVVRSRDLSGWTDDAWRDLDLRKDTPAAETLAKALGDKSLSPDQLRLLVQMSGKPGAAQALVDALAALDTPDAKDTLRTAVLDALARTGNDQAIARDLDLAQHPEKDFASNAASSIGRIESATPATRELLRNTLAKTQNENLKEKIVDAIGNVRDPEAVPLLSDLAKNGSDVVSKHAIVAIGRIGPAAEPAIPVLVDKFRGGDEATQGHVAIALGTIGTRAALSALEQLQTTKVPPSVQVAIRNAVARIRSETK